VDIQPDNGECLVGDSAAERQPHISHAANSHRRGFFGDARPQGPVARWLSFAGRRCFAASVEMHSICEVARHCCSCPLSLSAQTRQSAGAIGSFTLVQPALLPYTSTSSVIFCPNAVSLQGRLSLDCQFLWIGIRRSLPPHTSYRLISAAASGPSAGVQ